MAMPRILVTPLAWSFLIVGASAAARASIDASQVRAMKAQGLGASEIAKALKIGRASVYRFLETG
jgi:DNA invertase Pin-like site-specific DNA recombinase